MKLPKSSSWILLWRTGYLYLSVHHRACISFGLEQIGRWVYTAVLRIFGWHFRSLQLSDYECADVYTSSWSGFLKIPCRSQWNFSFASICPCCPCWSLLLLYCPNWWSRYENFGVLWGCLKWPIKKKVFTGSPYVNFSWCPCTFLSRYSQRKIEYTWRRTAMWKLWLRQ